MLDARQIVESAIYLVQDVDTAWQATLVEMTRADYHQSSFLDDRIKTAAHARRWRLPFTELNAAFASHEAARCDFIFHISHVGSTLVSKALDMMPQILPLREPVMLRWLAREQLTAGEAEGRMDQGTYIAFLGTALKILARPLEGSERSVVKATSFANTLAGDIMQLQPDARAIAISVPLETFLATILKGRGGWLDMLGNATDRLRRLHRILGYQRWRLAAMRPGELVAMSWLCEVVSLALVQRRHAKRMRWLDFNVYLAQPAAELRALSRHIGLDWTDAHSEALRRSGLSDCYSKTEGVAYDASQREADLAAVRARCADDIASGMAWIEAALRDHPSLAQIVPTFA